MHRESRRRRVQLINVTGQASGICNKCCISTQETSIELEAAVKFHIAYFVTFSHSAFIFLFVAKRERESVCVCHKAIMLLVRSRFFQLVRSLQKMPSPCSSRCDLFRTAHYLVCFSRDLNLKFEF
jgi:hypothetical protein